MATKAAGTADRHAGGTLRVDLKGGFTAPPVVLDFHRSEGNRKEAWDGGRAIWIDRGRPADELDQPRRDRVRPRGKDEDPLVLDRFDVLDDEPGLGT
jgi:hypothetical protein